jgi:hypothetical protein
MAIARQPWGFASVWQNMSLTLLGRVGMPANKLPQVGKEVKSKFARHSLVGGTP